MSTTTGMIKNIFLGSKGAIFVASTENNQKAEITNPKTFDTHETPTLFLAESLACRFKNYWNPRPKYNAESLHAGIKQQEEVPNKKFFDWLL